ncbi:hypothetical protein ACGFIW_18860 [Micromonospora sp. NPDC048935]|uniref:hypothetical protein n=1 Tax=Micromonospora sp. NPDC048935 TaxID=3364262 RepID=UPI003713693B
MIKEMPVSITASDIEKLFNEVADRPELVEAWAAADADVRFVISEPDADITLRRDGRVADVKPTHVLRIAWPDLEQIISGRRSFLRSVTGRRLTMTGPVLKSLAVGQALTAFDTLPL